MNRALYSKPVHPKDAYRQDFEDMQNEKLREFDLFQPRKPPVSRTSLFLALFGASLVLALGVLL